MPDETMPDNTSGRYPGYDVLAKRNGPSWNDKTRAVIDRRLAIDPEDHRIFDDAAWRTLKAVCDRIVPQPPKRAAPIPVAALLDRRLQEDRRDGHRDVRLPPIAEAWRRGLAALDAECRRAHDRPFHDLGPDQQDALLRAMQEGRLDDPAWEGMPSRLFFASRLLPDILEAYYSHPTAWNEIGFGGPASPRGYVRMGFDRRDPWEASEAKPGREDVAWEENRRVR
ncbi:gluconate 2-dehydrogenase subunit 3 family protein [Azospirillum canadense]|uniref:gluconate 2-dehydrogenase subunit 3 family protein n=1 Tax=Azospirillum canadense TaxID=403962 RepID=UPI0022269630|nr:gluconate 2-dehydrogenase subunit 3 family protein [Azospirillum canadense]MCW2239965.1 hypothetical protein [Azospirillum canadense]